MANPAHLQIIESLSVVAIKSIILAIQIDFIVLAILYIKVKNMSWHAKIGVTLVAYIFLMYVICSGLLLQLHSEYNEYLNFNSYMANWEWEHEVTDQIPIIITPLASIAAIITFISTFLNLRKEVKNGELINIRWSSRIILTIVVFVFCWFGFYFLLPGLLDLPVPVSGD